MENAPSAHSLTFSVIPMPARFSRVISPRAQMSFIFGSIHFARNLFQPLLNVPSAWEYFTTGTPHSMGTAAQTNAYVFMTNPRLSTKEIPASSMTMSHWEYALIILSFWSSFRNGGMYFRKLYSTDSGNARNSRRSGLALTTFMKSYFSGISAMSFRSALG